MDTEIKNVEYALKSRFAFGLGTTSYIIPDDIEPNVRYLAPLLDDIEIREKRFILADLSYCSDNMIETHLT